MSGVVAGDHQPNRPFNLLQHDGVRAPFLVIVDQGGDGESHSAGRRLSCQDFEDLFKVLVDLPEVSRTKGYYLPPVEPPPGHLKWAHDVIRPTADDI